MKVFIKTLKGTKFEIEVNPDDSIPDVKKNIENTQGITVYPAEQQMLIHQGTVLKDDSALKDYNVSEGAFMVVMLQKPKTTSVPATTSTSAPVPAVAPPTTPVPSTTPTAAAPNAPPTSATSAPVEGNVYGQAASNLVAGTNLEGIVQQILDMGGGSWDRDTVVRALRAAFNNPERAVEYLYSGIPPQAQIPVTTQAPANVQPVNPSAQIPQPAQPAAVPTGVPNANPLDLFPQGLPNIGANPGTGNLDVLRNSPQFGALQAMIQANPQVLQPMLQELGKQNPQIMRLIQENPAEFLRIMNEPTEGGESNLLGQLAGEMPQTVQVTPEEREAIERLEAMGFDHALVLQVFFACNKNEELAANYLLDHMNEFEE